MIGFVPTTDFARVKQFYADKLGLEFISDDGFALVFRSGRNMLRVVQLDDFEPQGFTILGWETPTSKAWREPSPRGVEFVRYPSFELDDLGIWTAPGGDRVAWFKDPDGNTLSISQHRSPVA